MCACAALAGGPGLHRTDATAALSPPPAAPDEAGWIGRESRLLLPEIFLAAGLLVACPVWFVMLLRQGHPVAAAVLFIGIAPAMLLARVAVRHKSAGGLYLASWVTFVAMAIAAVVQRLSS